MEKSINKSMLTEVSEKIAKFMNWEFEFVDNWDVLQPVIAKIFDKWDDTAELLYDYYFIEIYNCVNVYEALPKIERCIDELNKSNLSDSITINKLELASELADYIVKQEWDGALDEIITEDDNGDVRYTEMGQDLFNHYYDVFESIIEDCKS